MPPTKPPRPQAMADDARDRNAHQPRYSLVLACRAKAQPGPRVAQKQRHRDDEPRPTAILTTLSTETGTPPIRKGGEKAKGDGKV